MHVQAQRNNFHTFFLEATFSEHIIIAIVLVCISKALSNYYGVCVTKNVSAVARSMLSSLRTMMVWMIELVLNWEQFHQLQLVGFIILVFGNLIYNRIIELSFLEYDSLHEKEKDFLKIKRK